MKAKIVILGGFLTAASLLYGLSENIAATPEERLTQKDKEISSLRKELAQVRLQLKQAEQRALREKEKRLQQEAELNKVRKEFIDLIMTGSTDGKLEDISQDLNEALRQLEKEERPHSAERTAVDEVSANKIAGLENKIKKLEISLADSEKQLIRERKARTLIEEQSLAAERSVRDEDATSSAELMKLNNRIKRLEVSLADTKEKLKKEKAARIRVEEKLRIAGAPAIDSSSADEITTLNNRIGELEVSLADTKGKLKKEKEARIILEKRKTPVKIPVTGTGTSTEETAALNTKVKELETSLAAAEEKYKKEREARVKAEGQTKIVEKAVPVKDDTAVKKIEELNTEVKNLEASLAAAEEKYKKEREARVKAEGQTKIVEKAVPAKDDASAKEIAAQNTKIKGLEKSLADIKVKLQKEKDARVKAEEQNKAPAVPVKKEDASAKETAALNTKVKELEKSLADTEGKLKKEKEARVKAEGQTKIVEKTVTVKDDTSAKEIAAQNTKIKELEIALADTEEKFKKEREAKVRVEEQSKAPAVPIKKEDASAKETAALNTRVKELEKSLADTEGKLKKEKEARVKAEGQTKIVEKTVTVKDDTSAKEIAAQNTKIKVLETSLADTKGELKKEREARAQAEEKNRIAEKSAKDDSSDKEIAALNKKLKEIETTLANEKKELETERKSRKEAETKVKEIEKSKEAEAANISQEAQKLKIEIEKLKADLKSTEERAEKEELSRKKTEQMLDELKKKIQETEVAAKKEEEFRPKVYEVQEGDTLSSISEKVYGDSSRWKEIYQKNLELLKKEGLKSGLKLNIP
ncbi:hypothetical protein ACFLUV_01395 [Elusimicrobiota bacterium]